MTRKLSRGEQVKIAAADYNRWQEAGKADAMMKLGMTPGLVLPDTAHEGIILVKNTLPRFLKRYSVLGLRGTIPDPLLSSQQSTDFQDRIALKGETPSSVTTGRFCVIQTDAEVGEVVPALVSGVTPVRLSITAITDQYADIETNTAIDQTKWLKTGSTGAAQILYQPEYTGEQWGVVRLSNKPVSSGPKLVKFTTLPAAYGGNRQGISGSAVTSNGNDNPTDLQYYPRYVSVYGVNSSGDVVDTGEDIWVANLGSLPLTEGWGLAHKFTDSDPEFGTVYAINTDMSTSHHGAACYEWQQNSGGSPYTWIFNDGDSKLIRAATGLGLINPNSRSWAYAKSSDVFLTHVGRWEVTFGFSGYVGGDTHTLETTGAASAGTAHTHDYKQDTGGTFVFGVHRNFQPGTSVVGTNANPLWNINVYVPGRHVTSGANRRVMHEKTIYIPTQIVSPWHGQHHTRLSLFGYFNAEYKESGTPTFNLEKAWMRVKPCMGTEWDENNGNADFMGAGANQYPLNDYTSAGSGSGTFQWWGGGTEPAAISEAGV